MDNITLGEFEVVVNEGTSSFTIAHKGKTIKIVSAEAAAARSLVATIRTLLDVPVLPPSIAHSPFKAFFNEDGTIEMKHNSKEQGSIFVTKKNCDQLSKAIEMGVTKVSDLIRLRGGPRTGKAAFTTPEPVINGR